MIGMEKMGADMIGGSRNVPEVSAQESGPKGSRKPRTYASSREFWKLLETVQSSCERSCWRMLELGLVQLE